MYDFKNIFTEKFGVKFGEKFGVKVWCFFAQSTYC
jgi:hypothetical protein